MMRVANGRLAAYGLLGMPLAMAALPIYVHVPRFYSDTLGLPLASVGLWLLAARTLDALQDPLLGWWSDRNRARRGGRWIFVAAGAPLLALGMVGLFDPPQWGAGALQGWLIANLVLVYSAYSMVTVSYQAYGAEITADPAERTRVTAWREGFALLGVFAAAVAPEVLRRASGERAGFAQFAYAFVPLALVAAWVSARFSPPAPVRAAAAVPGIGALWLPLGNPRFRRLALVFLLNGIAAAIPATLVLFFIADVVGRADLTAHFLVAYFAAGACGMPAWVWLARRVGKVRAWLAGMALAIVAFVWAFFLGAGDAGAYFAICLLSGAALGADLAIPPSLLADVIDADEARGEARSEGAYFGLWNLMNKLNLALAAGLALPLLAAGGYRSGVMATGGTLVALAGVYALLPCALKALAALVLWKSNLEPGESP